LSFFSFIYAETSGTLLVVSHYTLFIKEIEGERVIEVC